MAIDPPRAPTPTSYAPAPPPRGIAWRRPDLTAYYRAAMAGPETHGAADKSNGVRPRLFHDRLRWPEDGPFPKALTGTQRRAIARAAREGT